jgi:hypothetical protein
VARSSSSGELNDRPAMVQHQQVDAKLLILACSMVKDRGASEQAGRSASTLDRNDLVKLLPVLMKEKVIPHWRTVVSGKTQEIRVNHSREKNACVLHLTDNG